MRLLRRKVDRSSYPGNEESCVEIQRYAAFAGPFYYPQGGFRDFVSTSSTPERAADIGRTHALNLHEVSGSWWHVVDLLSGEIIDGDD